ncbi:MAG: FG-GAP-like repeat-containing protein [Bacteroidota bacterium]
MKGQLATLLLILCCLGCQPDGSDRMRAHLQQIVAEAPNKTYPYLNKLAAAKMYAQMQQESPAKAKEMEVKWAEQLLWAGENDSAILILQNWIDERGERDTLTYNNEYAFQLLGQAYLRKGERENCLNHHDPASCILPIADGGIHQLIDGSSEAIRIYRTYLRTFPTDLQARWLLNLAYMTLGQYPDSVPANFLIPPEHFSSDFPLARFPDRAMGTGVAIESLAGGCAIEDFNADGHLDIFATSFGLEDGAQLMINDGLGRFANASVDAGLQGINGGLNLIHGDYDNDGLEDIFILRGAWLNNDGDHPNSLLHNDGAGRFSDRTQEAGVLSFHPTQTAVFLDVNLDGWLDLFIGNETNPDGLHPTELYINQQDGTFQEQAQAYGLRMNQFVKSVVSGDFNNDGWPDLYVSILGGRNKLFINQGEESHFVERAQASGVDQPFFSFPSWVWDYNQDGHEDLLVFGFNSRRYNKLSADVAADYLDLPGKGIRPHLYENQGDGTFHEVGQEKGLDHVLYAMGCNFGDLDQDGWLDLYAGTGAPDFMSLIPNRVFRNDSGRGFQDVTTTGGFGQIQKGHAVAFGDVDQDGDEDIYTVLGGFFEGDVYPNSLLENPGSDHAWITLKLAGSRANRSAIGARVKIQARDKTGKKYTFFRTVSTGGSFGSSSLQLEIGLGDCEKIDWIEVQWPDREHSLDRYESLVPRQKYYLEQGQPAEAQKLRAMSLLNEMTHE